MKNSSRVILWMCVCLMPASGGESLLRFRNGDQLHGSYLGISEGSSIVWERNGAEGQMKFKLTDVRHVIMDRVGEDLKSSGMAHVGTVNGDRIPGEVIGMTPSHVTVQTPMSGTIQMSRDEVGMIAPNPLGGRLRYHGPFDKEGWLMVNAENPHGFLEKELEKNEDLKQRSWKFSGSAWYWDQKGFGTGLIHKTGMTDESVLKFQASWKGRLSLAIGFHADFTKPEVIVEDEKQQVQLMGRSVSLPAVFGTGYVLHLYSNYVSLYKTSFDEEGKARTDRLQAVNSAVRLGDTGSAEIEIRCNRKTGDIYLFIENQYVCQWIESAEEGVGGAVYGGPGDGFGFMVQAEESPVRISEIVVSDWNGLPDSARSLQVADADVVLLANGRDRFSGRVVEIADKRLKIESRFGDFVLPMEEVSEVRFAKSGLAEEGDESSADVKVRFHPMGRVSGRMLSGSGNKLTLEHGSVGQMEIGLESVTMLEFEENGDFVDDWDADF